MVLFIRVYLEIRSGIFTKVLGNSLLHSVLLTKKKYFQLDFEVVSKKISYSVGKAKGSTT